MPLIVCKDNKKVRKKKRSLCKITWTKRKSGKLKPYFTRTFLNLESQTCPTNSLSIANKAICEGAETSNLSGNDFRRARKCQTIREMTFAKRGNAKPFGKWLSPSAETPNLSGNDFRQARKCQTFRETTFAERGNAKPFKKVICGRPASAKTFKKWFAGGPQAPKSLKSDLREARKR